MLVVAGVGLALVAMMSGSALLFELSLGLAAAVAGTALWLWPVPRISLGVSGLLVAVIGWLALAQGTALLTSVRPGAVLGIRPEHLSFSDDGWLVRIEQIEMLGAERLIYARIGDEQLVMRADEGVAVPDLGSSVRMAARQDRLHWFDAGSGKRLPDA